MQNYQINDKNVSNKQSLINCSQYKKFLPFCFYHLKGLLTKVTCYAIGITNVKEKHIEIIIYSKKKLHFTE